MKNCTKCQKTKPLDSFHRDRTHKDGRKTRCRECEREFVPVEARCHKCGDWFTKKAKNHRFCTLRCTSRYHVHIYNQSVARTFSIMKYLNAHRKELSAKASKWYWENRERALGRKRRVV